MTKPNAALSLAIAAGLTAPALAQDTTSLSGRTMRALPVANIHINMATGERTITPIDAGARSGSSALWLNNNTDPCATGGTVGVIDDPDLDADGFGDFAGTPCDGDLPCEGAMYLWWGDIEPDSVADCLVITYATTVPDIDVDSDSIGDGVVGYDLTITFADNDNGRGADGPGLSGRSCILDLTIPTLAGQVGSLPPGFAAVYILTLDFASLAPSLIFELGDTNGIDDAGTGISGGALYGPNNGFPNTSGQDIDSDGLADFSWSYRFNQSTLSPAHRGMSGFITAGPSDGIPPNSTGTEDLFDVYTAGPSCPTYYEPTYLGSFDLGGFSCEPGNAALYASSWIEMYGTQGNPFPCGDCLLGDIAEPFGTLDFADVIAFLQAFAECSQCGDYVVPLGICDFSDVLAFLTAFGAGCP